MTVKMYWSDAYSVSELDAESTSGNAAKAHRETHALEHAGYVNWVVLLTLTNKY